MSKTPNILIFLLKMPQFTRFFPSKIENFGNITCVKHLTNSMSVSCEKYTKKCVNSQHKSQNLPQRQKFCLFYAEKYISLKKVVTNMSYEWRQLMMVFFVSIYKAPDWFWRTSFWHFEAKTNWEPWQLPRWFWSLQFTIQLCNCASIVSEFVLYKKEFFITIKMLRWPTS